MPAILTFLLLLLPACSSKTLRYESLDPSPHRTAIIFVPGFYGTALADEHTGERYFLSAWGSLFGRTPLALSEPDLGISGARSLRPDGVLLHVPVVPGIYSVNVYGEALDFLQSKFGNEAEIIPFDYDWRQELSLSTRRLDRVIQDLKTKGIQRILIVAHSLGGLLTTYYLRYGTQSPKDAVDNLEASRNISAAVILGTPFQGAPGAFRNIHMGTSLGTASIPLGADSLGSFQSMYQLLPQPESGTYIRTDGKPLGNEVLSLEFWKQARFGLLQERPQLTQNIRLNREHYVERSLKTARLFYEKLCQSEATTSKSPSMLYVRGVGKPTVSRLLWNPAHGAWIFDEEVAKSTFPDMYEDGDGTVPLSSATPPEPLIRRLPGQLLSLEASHEEMFESEAILGATETFLRSHLYPLQASDTSHR